jgi:hypothetical protein
MFQQDQIVLWHGLACRRSECAGKLGIHLEMLVGVLFWASYGTWVQLEKAEVIIDAMKTHYFSDFDDVVRALNYQLRLMNTVPK